MRKEVEERSAGLAVAHAEVLQITEKNRAIAAEQKLAVASEHDRADALARELASVRDELEARDRQVAALNAPLAVHSCEPAVDRSEGRIAESSAPHPGRRPPAGTDFRRNRRREPGTVVRFGITASVGAVDWP